MNAAITAAAAAMAQAIAAIPPSPGKSMPISAPGRVNDAVLAAMAEARNTTRTAMVDDDAIAQLPGWNPPGS